MENTIKHNGLFKVAAGKAAVSYDTLGRVTGVIEGPVEICWVAGKTYHSVEIVAAEEADAILDKLTAPNTQVTDFVRSCRALA